MLNEAWQHDPLTRDWEAAERRFKPPPRHTAVQAQEAALPSYQKLLLEFERRTKVLHQPARVPAIEGPSPADLFLEHERRTGKPIDV